MQKNIYFKDRNNNNYTKYIKEKIRDKVIPHKHFIQEHSHEIGGTK